MLNLTILSFTITVVLELPVVWLFTKKNICNLAGYVFVINLFTWPLADIINDYIDFYITESTVVLVESVLFILLLKMKCSKALLASFTANVVSAISGYVLSSLS